MSDLFVNGDELHAGSGHCGNAANAAKEGANNLAGEKLSAGIFGDFSAAQQFHQTVSGAHGDHVEQLRGHHTDLTSIKTTAQGNARSFAEREAANTALFGPPGSGVAG